MYATYGWEQINSTAHQQINFEAALQGLVLLKNTNSTLPLEKGISVAVVGPHAVSQMGLFSDYAADELCFGGTFDCVPTIGQQIDQVNTGSGGTIISKGVDINSNDTSGIQDALSAVQVLSTNMRYQRKKTKQNKNIFLR
eukprot:m.171206 g.171206  ORF g.171206 m.171206 type:complete len:140 (-) comp14549_c0_seq6:7725-8144(-)